MFLIRDLTKFYGQHRAIDRFNAALQPGLFLALLGRNGSGDEPAPLCDRRPRRDHGRALSLRPLSIAHVTSDEAIISLAKLETICQAFPTDSQAEFACLSNGRMGDDREAVALFNQTWSERETEDLLDSNVETAVAVGLLAARRATPPMSKALHDMVQAQLGRGDRLSTLARTTLSGYARNFAPRLRLAPADQRAPASSQPPATARPATAAGAK